MQLVLQLLRVQLLVLARPPPLLGRSLSLACKRTIRQQGGHVSENTCARRGERMRVNGLYS